MKEVDGGNELAVMIILLLMKISDRVNGFARERGMVGERINPSPAPFRALSQHDSI